MVRKIIIWINRLGLLTVVLAVLGLFLLGFSLSLVILMVAGGLGTAFAFSLLGGAMDTFREHKNAKAVAKVG
jgi:hypothetical protein